MRRAPNLLKTNPFERLTTANMRVEALTANDRLLMVRGFNALNCLRALRTPGLQPTVRRALRRRMSELGIDLASLEALRVEERGR